MAYSDAKVSEVVAGAASLATRPFVVSVEDHYAGYWDELGITILLRDSAKDAEALGLRNSLLEYLGNVLPEGNAYFSWTVRFIRRNKCIEVLFPGDQPRELTDILSPM